MKLETKFNYNDSSVVDNRISTLIDTINKRNNADVFKTIIDSEIILGLNLVKDVNSEFSFEKIELEEVQKINRTVFERADTEKYMGHILDVGILYGLKIVDSVSYENKKKKILVR